MRNHIFPLALFLILVAIPDQTAARDYLLDVDGTGLQFTEQVIGDLVVYHHQRMIGEALVEKDAIVYQFDRVSGKLLKKRQHWRTDLPSELPADLLTAEQAAALTTGEVQSARLVYVSPESAVLPLDPPPQNPCWVVRTQTDDDLDVFIIDAVTGRDLGRGVPPPAALYGMSGPVQSTSCAGNWLPWVQSAEYWFKRLGYATSTGFWPTEAAIRQQLQSLETSAFYEIAHGGSTAFKASCDESGNSVSIFATYIAHWLRDRPKLPFAFIASCNGLCATDQLDCFSYVLRKGENVGTAVAGYCGMSYERCDECWFDALDWQDAFFYYLVHGYKVQDSFLQTMADYPACRSGQCMVVSGDPDLTLVPTLFRTDDAAPGFFLAQEAVLSPHRTVEILLAPSAQVRPYLLDVTPLGSAGADFAELGLATRFVENGWVDVAALRLAEGAPDLPVQVCVYHGRGLPIVRQELVELEPGQPYRITLGPSTDPAAYLPEFTPVYPAAEQLSAFALKPVFDGAAWQDVLDIELVPSDGPVPAEAVVQVYDAASLPVHAQTTVVLRPGVAQDIELGESAIDVAYLPKVTPLTPAEAELTRIQVLPVLKGRKWLDVLRLQTRPGDPQLEVAVTVHGLSAPEPKLSPVRDDGRAPAPGAIDGMVVLGQNEPNPFNPSTSIRFWLGRAQDVRLEIFAVDGTRVAVLADGQFPEGEHVVQWTGRDQGSRQVASGTYFYRLTTGLETVTRRLLLLR